MIKYTPDEKEFGDNIKVGEILNTSEEMNAFVHWGIKRAVVVETTARPDKGLLPLLVVVDQDLEIHEIGSSHFYQTPDVKEMTVSAISKELGYEVKIVR